jgi:3-methyladenine DNA glycosylase AlkC
MAKPITKRKGARSLALIPNDVLTELNSGESESVNLMEWLAVDMDLLAKRIFDANALMPWGREVLHRLPLLRPMGVTRRLATVGAAISQVVNDACHPVFAHLAHHQSDIVRQWGVYAVNALLNLSLAERLQLTRPYASDRNMTVRECAWMAFRPHLSRELTEGLRRLLAWTRDVDPNVRRFAIEVTRPRSVWGAHIPLLKVRPNLALSLLVNVRSDPSAYVRRAVANWLNDAWKSTPEWVERLCGEWAKTGNEYTTWIVDQALRSKRRQR